MGLIDLTPIDRLIISFNYFLVVTMYKYMPIDCLIISFNYFLVATMYKYTCAGQQAKILPGPAVA